MLFVNYFKIITILMITSIANASIVDKVCGNYIFRVNIGKDPIDYDPEFTLYFKGNAQQFISFYVTKSVRYLNAACVQNNKGQNLFLFQAFCGGSGCPEDRFGIFDPDTKKMLIKPGHWLKGNYKQAKQFVSEDVLEQLIRHEKNFCCDNKE